MKIKLIDKKDPKRKEYVAVVFEEVEKFQINYVRLQFTDIHGMIKSFTVIPLFSEEEFE